METETLPTIAAMAAKHGEDSVWDYVGDCWGSERTQATLREYAEMLTALGWNDDNLIFYRFGIRGDQRPRLCERDTQNTVLILMEGS